MWIIMADNTMDKSHVSRAAVFSKCCANTFIVHTVQDRVYFRGGDRGGAFAPPYEGLCPPSEIG